MRRLFVHFYIFIILAVIGLGWSLEHILREEEPSMPVWMPPFASLLSAQVPHMSHPNQLAEQLNETVIAMPLSAVAWPEPELQRLATGEAIALFNSRQQIYFYLLAQHQPEAELWRIGPIGQPVDKPTYWYHLLAFALLILLATLWVWPLARDLLKIERHLGKLPQQTQQPLRLPKRSMVSSLADSMNAMRKQIQHLLGLQRELTRAVSHDLRTPLTRMKFTLALLTEKKHQDALSADVIEMEQMVETLLDYAKLEGQEKLLQRSKVNMNELCVNLVDKLNSMPGPQVQLHMSGYISCLCDGHYIERALQNLIQNARVFANEKVDVWVIKKKNHVIMHVDDDGPGIAEDDHAYILQPFVRLDPSREKAHGGQGLGLTIVARIAEWHQADLSIHTSPLGGARFTFTLPA
ncbi:two-component sensor histidine kinase [Aliidiomarina taiwanensis]|uniref:histidine kinase n=1 Tax=Aliidiomarina taiwanensis TaxID=946228 RepID=A0A432X8N0_9GAMM|nr:ATP-binding protein [Aliidiomarina taiwanensis]RUO43752.1 two-component sensor histidine kinase [Aliidiomarina taiwanensis]